MEKFELQLGEQHEKNAIFYVPTEKIRISEKQQKKVSRDKVERHKKWLMDHPDEDLLPINAHELEDGTFIIDGNGRHRYFAYLEMGYGVIPLNIKQREGFRPTKEEKKENNPYDIFYKLADRAVCRRRKRLKIKENPYVGY